MMMPISQSELVGGFSFETPGLSLLSRLWCIIWCLHRGSNWSEMSSRYVMLLDDHIEGSLFLIEHDAVDQELVAPPRCGSIRSRRSRALSLSSSLPLPTASSARRLSFRCSLLCSIMSLARLAPLAVATVLATPALAAAPIPLTFSAPPTGNVVQSNFFGISIELSFLDLYCALILSFTVPLPVLPDLVVLLPLHLVRY
jgi:hypothetical protein